jgi:hypothetical protein
VTSASVEMVYDAFVPASAASGGLGLGLRAHEREADFAAASVHRQAHRAVELVRHVHALDVVAVGADELHVIPVDGDEVVRRGRQRRVDRAGSFSASRKFTWPGSWKIVGTSTSLPLICCLTSVSTSEGSDENCLSGVTPAAADMASMIK